MKRRGFLGRGTLAGAASLVPGALRAQQAPPIVAQPDAAAPFDVPPFELEEATIVELQQRMSAGSLSSRRVVQLYLERISALDRQGPEIRS